MATLPTRASSFPAAFESIANQVDRIYVYFDGHSDVPDVARRHGRVVPVLSSDAPDMHGNGKFLGLLLEPAHCLYMGVDDDIIYPPDYVETLRQALDARGGRAVVGYHGSTFLHPFVSYQQSRHVRYFGSRFNEAQVVDALGTGTVIFDTAALRFDVREWAHVNMSDLQLAIEATLAGLPMVSLPREEGYLRAVETDQQDSIYAGVVADDSRQTQLAKELQELRAGQLARETRR